MVRFGFTEKIRREARTLQDPRFAQAATALAWVLLLASCATGTPKAVPPPVGGLAATLEDEVRDLPHGQIAWSTYWKLCWAEYPGAVGYEIQTVTSEGMSPKLRRQRERCFRIEAAANENEKSQGLLNRDVLLALQSGQLAYRVRAVLEKDHVSEWSPPMAVGKATRH